MASIRINVFDLTELNSVFRCCKIGVYHTSIVIDNKDEYYFGFAQYGYTGIDSPEKIDHIPSSMIGTLYTQVELGKSLFNYQDCCNIIQQFFESEEWLSDAYNMLFHNCNDFTLAVSKALFEPDVIKKLYPFWVQRGISIGKWFFSTSIAYTLHLLPIHIQNFALPVQHQETGFQKGESFDESPHSISMEAEQV